MNTVADARTQGRTEARFDAYDPKAARILVVDDEPANLKLLSLMLRTEGYHHVELVQDPREVLPRYQAARPDLILLDINMPHLDGYDVMAQIKSLSDELKPPVVVLTAQSGEDFLLRALRSGAIDFLSKPFNRRELLARVQNVLMAHLAHRLIHTQKQLLEQMVDERTQELRRSRLDIVRRLGRASEFRDNETGQHILRMSHASALLARSAGWDATACELMLNASPMHDVGKIGIPDGILLKPGPLTADERDIMKRHTTIGAEILADSGTDLLEMAREIALSHHEKWDGTGYPQQLVGTAIPEAARIVAITDVFDALTSERPYKKPWSVAETMRFMNANAGRQFDPQLLEKFTSLIPEVQLIRERFAEPDLDCEADADLIDKR
jgi:putative two-component system response regulator